MGARRVALRNDDRLEAVSRQHRVRGELSDPQRPTSGVSIACDASPAGYDHAMSPKAFVSTLPTCERSVRRAGSDRRTRRASQWKTHCVPVERGRRGGIDRVSEPCDCRLVRLPSSEVVQRVRGSRALDCCVAARKPLARARSGLLRRRDARGVDNRPCPNWPAESDRQAVGRCIQEYEEALAGRWAGAGGRGHRRCI